MAVVMEVVKGYDIDGVHIDDYFYPYPKENLPFPDDRSYAASGSKLPRDQWRRENINRFVERFYREVKTAKPQVQVGISPFGIWRPGHPPSIKGFDAYDKLYADARTWLHEGWCDYLVPQLYWPIDQREQAFDVLLDWWIGQNPKNVKIYAGLFTDRATQPQTKWPAGEIVRQIRLARTRTGAQGHVHFSARPLMENRAGITDELKREAY